MNEDQLSQRLAALPRAMAPEHDLWPGIAARLNRRRPRASWPAAVPAVAAALAVAVALGLVISRDPVAGGLSVDPALADAYASLVDARADLGEDTVALMRDQQALGLTAVERLTAALERRPDDPELQRQLLDAYRGQVLQLDYLGRAPRGIF